MMTAQNITSKHIECLLLPPRLPANTSLLVARICPISTHDPMQITVAMITVEDCPAIYMIHSVGVSRESASTIEGKVSIVSCQLQIHLHSSFLVVSRLNWSMAISRWSEKGLKSQIFLHPVWGLFVELSCVVLCCVLWLARTLFVVYIHHGVAWLVGFHRFGTNEIFSPTVFTYPTSMQLQVVDSHNVLTHFLQRQVKIQCSKVGHILLVGISAVKAKVSHCSAYRYSMRVCILFAKRCDYFR